jgi:hypothetical protein
MLTLTVLFCLITFIMWSVLLFSVFTTVVTTVRDLIMYAVRQVGLTVAAARIKR